MLNLIQHLLALEIAGQARNDEKPKPNAQRFHCSIQAHAFGNKTVG